MSSTILHKAMYIGVGVITAIYAPTSVARLTYQHTANTLLAAASAAAAIYFLMAISVAVLSLLQYLPDSYALGPSFMAGWGILTVGVTIIPLLVLPGAVWLYILPFNEAGTLNWNATLQLDPDSFEKPHHN